MMNIKGLVISGGGLRGLAFIGSLKALEEMMLVQQIELLAGCSIGAVMATMISIGYTSEELYDFILHFKYDDIKDINFLGFFENYGIETGNLVYEFLRIMIRRKTGVENITFKELWDKTKKHLIVNATCVNKHKIEYFDYINTPDMSVALALRMSTSLPFLFKPVEYNGKLYSDGGLIDNFPLHLFGDTDGILGLKLTNDNQPVENIDSLESYLLHTWSTIYSELNRIRLGTVREGHHLVLIPVTCVHTFNFNLNQDQRIQIYQQGYNTTIKYLKRLEREQLSTKKDNSKDGNKGLIKEILSDIGDKTITEKIEIARNS